MSKIVCIALLFCLIFELGTTAMCHGKPGQKFVNKEPVWKGQPRLLRSHTHGKLFEIGTGTTTMKLLRVYGNMYQMGFAQGFLLRDELNQFLKELWIYIEEQV